MARKRYHMFIANGMLSAASNAIKDSVLDPRGGGLNTFSVPLRRIDDPNALWWGASWVMEETGPGISFQTFQTDIIQALNMKHNSGLANVQICTYVHEDEFPALGPAVAFATALLGVVKKPWILEKVPSQGIGG